jgi:hypothetical protein
MNQLPCLNVAKPTPTKCGLTIVVIVVVVVVVVVVVLGTQHVKLPLLLLVLVNESGLLPLLSGPPNLLKSRARVLKRTRVFIGLNSL